MFLNLQHPHIRYIAPPAEGGSDTTDPTPPAEPNGNGEEIDWEELEAEGASTLGEDTGHRDEVDEVEGWADVEPDLRADRDACPGDDAGRFPRADAAPAAQL